MFASERLNLPLLAAFERFIVHGFHFKSNRGSLQHSTHRYNNRDDARKTSAEYFNVRFKDALGLVRYLRGNNVLAYLHVGCMVLNISSVFKERHRWSNVEEEDRSSLLRSTFSHNCVFCHLLWSASGKNKNQLAAPYQYEDTESAPIFCDL